MKTDVFGLLAQLEVQVEVRSDSVEIGLTRLKSEYRRNRCDTSVLFPGSPRNNQEHVGTVLVVHESCSESCAQTCTCLCRFSTRTVN